MKKKCIYIYNQGVKLHCLKSHIKPTGLDFHHWPLSFIVSSSLPPFTFEHFPTDHHLLSFYCTKLRSCTQAYTTPPIARTPKQVLNPSDVQPLSCPITSLSLTPFQDIMTLVHFSGISSILISGSADLNLKLMRLNLKAHKCEVHASLVKIQPDVISLDAKFVVSLVLESKMMRAVVLMSIGEEMSRVNRLHVAGRMVWVKLWEVIMMMGVEIRRKRIHLPQTMILPSTLLPVSCSFAGA